MEFAFVAVGDAACDGLADCVEEATGVALVEPVAAPEEQAAKNGIETIANTTLFVICNEFIYFD